MSVVKHFLDWNQPLPAQAAAWLAEGRTGTPIDLSDTWAIVPTRQAGRRLREAIARHAHTLGTVAMAPRVTLADALFEQGRSVRLASPSAVRLHWVRTLMAASHDEYPDFVPEQRVLRSMRWALSLAERLASLRKLLTEGGLSIRDVPGNAGPYFPESGRWEQLAALESEFLAKLRDAGLRDSEEAKLAVALEPGTPPLGIRRVALIGNPDPLPLALKVLAAWSAQTSVHVVVHAPGSRSPGFDEWGRPLRGKWPDREDDLPDFENHVHLCAGPEDQARRIVEWAGGYDEVETLLAVGCADETVVPSIGSALSASGIAHFDPEGRLLEGSGIASFTGLLRRSCVDPSFDVASDLARRPEVIAWMESRLGEAFKLTSFLAGLDELAARHLPATLDAAIDHSPGLEQAHPGLGAGLELLGELAGLARRAEFPDGLLKLLSSVLTPGGADPRGLDEIEALREVIDEVSDAGGGQRVAADEGWELTQAGLSRVRLYEEKPAGAIEIQGWLELLWEDAPHVVVAGMNEGSVPASITADAFLPGSLREHLGLRSNADRLARDGYILASIRAARGLQGRVDLLFGKFGESGDPLHPSRLLLACSEDELPSRVEFLFREAPNSRSNIPWSRAWTLQVPASRIPETISVTAFRDYLSCPFRFHLKHMLGMVEVEPEKRELDARDFGTLLHAVLEGLGKHDSWRDCTDGLMLSGLFSEELDRIVEGRFGRSLNLPLVIQIDSARQRLHQAAFVQAAERAEGWRIEEVEWKIPKGSLAFETLEVRGKIDRIERHEKTGLVRVLDYKTSDTAVAPEDAHRKRITRGKGARHEFAKCDAGGSPAEWTDLQLPLYRVAAARFGGEVACGYFNLPKAVSETAIAIWEDLDDAQASAIECARAVASRVKQGVFWPPNEEERDDEFSRMFHEGVAESIDPESRPTGEKR